MAHKSEKGSWSKSANMGCMWGLISMFNFRRFTSRRFLVSQNRRSGRQPFGKWYSRRRMKLLTNSDGKTKHLSTVDAGETNNGNSVTESVKNLMNKEMSISKQTQKNSNAESSRTTDDSSECLDSNRSSSDKALEVDKSRNAHELSIHRSMGPYRSLFLDVTERISRKFDLAVIVNDMEGGKRNHQNVHWDSEKDIDKYLSAERTNSDLLPFLGQINGGACLGLSTLQQVLCETLEADLCSKFPDAVRTSPEDVCNTDEDLRHSLEMSALYKEIFLDALIRVLQNPMSSQCGMSDTKHLENVVDSSKQEISFCYPKKKQEVEKNLLNEHSYKQSSLVNNKSQSSSRIVILKPNLRKTKVVSNGTGLSSQAYSSGLRLKEENGTLTSHLFFHDVKRRLAHLLGDKHISQDAQVGDIGSSHGRRQATNGIPKRSELEEHKALSSKIGFEVDSVNISRCNNDTYLGTSSSLCKESDILTMCTATESGDFPAKSEKKGSNSLRKLFSLPVDYSKDPRYWSEKDVVATVSPQHIRSQSWSSEQVDLKLGSQPLCNIASSQQMIEPNTGLSTTGIEEISRKNASLREGSSKCGPNVSLSAENGIVVGDVTKHIENHSSPASFPSASLVPVEENSKHLHPSSTTMLDAFLVSSPEIIETTGDKQERPSPVSVLEISAIDNMGRPESTFTINESYPKFKVVPRHLYFEDSEDSEGFLQKSSSQAHLSTCMADEEFKYGYVKSLLEAAGFSHYPLPIKSLLSHPLLDPSLYDEVETPSEEIPDDLKLFFDCVADVLEEIYERSSSSKPWVLFAKPELRVFPGGEKLIKEVIRELNGLYVLRLPKTFEEIVKRELENGPWMDIRAAVEDFGLEVGQVILDKLLEETVLELWD